MNENLPIMVVEISSEVSDSVYKELVNELKKLEGQLRVCLIRGATKVTIIK